MWPDEDGAVPLYGHTGMRVGGWWLRERIGAGAFGETWRARDASGRVAACKLLQTPPGSELEALSKLSHPAIPTLLDGGVDPVPYIAMEAVPGTPASAWLDQGPQPFDTVLQLGVILADALDAVHRAGLWHGDVSAENILITADPTHHAWLIDFGLASQSGGTPAWAAPEVLCSQPSSPASDLYSLGMVLRAMLVGAWPGSASDPDTVIGARTSRAPEPVDGAPAWFQALLTRMLSPTPAVRPSAADVVDALSLHGAEPPRLGVRQLRERARVAHVELPGVREALGRWLRDRGALALLGSRGSGRSHALRKLAWALSSEGEPFVLVQPATTPWRGIQDALRRAGLPVPTVRDPLSRLDAMATTLLQSKAALLVPNLDGCDDRSREVILAVIEAGGPAVVCAQDGAPAAATAVRLPPLDGAGARALLGVLLGENRSSDGLADAVLRRSGGRPGLVVELLCAGLQSGALHREHRTWVWREGFAPDVSADPEVGALLDELPAATVELAGVVALQSRGVTLPTLAAATERRVAELDGLLHPLVLRGLVEFVDDLVCVVADARAPTLDRLERHHTWRRRLFDALKRQDPLDPVGLVEHAEALGATGVLHAHAANAVLELMRLEPVEAARMAERLWACLPIPDLALARARALRAAGDVQGALRFGRLALPHLDPQRRVALCGLLASFAVDELQREVEARRWLQRADRERGVAKASPRLQLVRAQLAQLAGDFEEVVALLTDAVTSAPAADSESVEIWLYSCVLLAQAHHRLGDLDKGVALLAAVPASRGEGTPARARVSAALGRLHWVAGRYAEADAAMAAASARDSGLYAADRGRLLNNLGAARFHLGRRNGAVAAWEEAQALFARLGLDRESARCLGNLCAAYTDRGQWERAEQAGVRALSVSRALGDDELQVHAYLNLGRLELMTERPVAAENHLVKAIELATAGGLLREKVEGLVRMAEHAAITRSPTAREAAERAVAEASRAQQPVDLAEAQTLCLAAIAEDSQDAEGLLAEVTAVLAPLREEGAAAALAHARPWAALALARAGRMEEARRLLDQARVYAEQSGSVLLVTRTDWVNAQIRELSQADGGTSELTRLVELAVAINESEALDGLLVRIADAGRELLAGDRAFVLSPDGTMLVSVPPDADGVPSQSVVSQVVATLREVVVADLSERGDLREQRSVAAMSLRSVHCSPLVHRGDLLGVLYVDSSGVQDSDDWKRMQLIRGLAALAAVAIRRTRVHEERVEAARITARLAERAEAADQLRLANEALETANQKLRLAAIIDPLTELYNRRHLTDVLGQATAALARGQAPYGLVLLDIDHFKRINDTWGHPVGDAVLRWVAEKLRNAARENDRVFRFGGEEMLLLMDEATEPGMAAMAERMRTDLCAEPFVTDDGESFTVTASLGTALGARRSETWEEVLRRADDALYRAKETGRNRVVAADPES